MGKPGEGAVERLALRDDLDVAVTQGTEVTDKRTLFAGRQLEVAELFRVHVFRNLGCGPAVHTDLRTRDALAGSEDVARVVEVHDVLEGGEGAVVHVRLGGATRTT